MDVVFGNEDLSRLETETRYTMGLPPHLVSKYRSRLQFIRAARDARDLREMKSLRFEKLKGNRNHQHSIRLNSQYRITLELIQESDEQAVLIVGVEDYH